MAGDPIHPSFPGTLSVLFFKKLCPDVLQKLPTNDSVTCALLKIQAAYQDMDMCTTTIYFLQKFERFKCVHCVLLCFITPLQYLPLMDFRTMYCITCKLPGSRSVHYFAVSSKHNKKTAWFI
jgi:hypothetical protein